MTDSTIDTKTSLPEQAHNSNQWRYNMLRRGLYMLLFLAIYFVIEIAIKVLVVGHFIYRLITPTPQPHLLRFGDQLSLYMYQLWRYLTFNNEQQPWPFAPWPSATTPRPDTTEIEINPETKPVSDNGTPAP